MKFNIDDPMDMILYEFATQKDNISGYIKELIASDMSDYDWVSACYGCMGAAFGDCGSCEKGGDE